MSRITSFTDLEAWKESHKLVLMIYKISDNFPTTEKFGLVNQIRRAVVSVTSNLAEGFSRNSSKEKVQFYYMSVGSLTEVQNQLIISKDLKYVSGEEYNPIYDQLMFCGRLIQGLIKSAKKMVR